MAFKLNKETLHGLEKKDILENKNRISLFDKKVTHSKIVYDIPELKHDCSMQSVIVDKNIKLCYECEGNKQNKAIILMPSGPGGTHGVYHPYFSKLANEYFVVYFI